MDSLFDALPYLIALFVIITVIRGLVQMARKLSEPPPGTPRSAAAPDPAQAERTRRIQEEIRRKIAERRGFAPPIGLPPIMAEAAPEPAAPPADEPATSPSLAVVLEGQRQLAEQMRALEAARVQGERRAANAEAMSAATAIPAPAANITAELLANLRDPLTVRRAWLMREILDRPVGLR